MSRKLSKKSSPRAKVLEIMVRFSEAEDESTPCTLHEVAQPRAIVLLGHGLGVDRHHQTVLGPARLLNDYGFSVIVPELPLHGERNVSGFGGAEIVSAWQASWAGEGRHQLLMEWRNMVEFAKQTFQLPVMYFGLSLGTQYGVLLLSQTADIRAAVLGLFGSEPPPKSIIMNRCAPEISVPVYFILKRDDEIHAEENARHLYDSIGSDHKVLDATPGRHGDVSLESIRSACMFLAERIPNEPNAHSR